MAWAPQVRAKARGVGIVLGPVAAAFSDGNFARPKSSTLIVLSNEASSPPTMAMWSGLTSRWTIFSVEKSCPLVSRGQGSNERSGSSVGMVGQHLVDDEPGLASGQHRGAAQAQGTAQQPLEPAPLATRRC